MNDIPKDAIKAVAEVILANWVEDGGSPVSWEDFTEQAAALIGAAAPHLETALRQTIAEAIEKRGRELRMAEDDGISREEWACFGESAAIARGEQP
jgi:hypothetical protein